MIPLPDPNAPNAFLIANLASLVTFLATFVMACYTVGMDFFPRTFEPTALTLVLAVSHAQSQLTPVRLSGLGTNTPTAQI